MILICSGLHSPEPLLGEFQEVFRILPTHVGDQIFDLGLHLLLISGGCLFLSANPLLGTYDFATNPFLGKHPSDTASYHQAQ